jgi:hypothetical protein
LTDEYEKKYTMSKENFVYEGSEQRAHDASKEEKVIQHDACIIKCQVENVEG